MVHDISNEKPNPDFKFIALFKKCVRPEIENAVSYLLDTTVD